MITLITTKFLWISVALLSTIILVFIRLICNRFIGTFIENIPDFIEIAIYFLSAAFLMWSAIGLPLAELPMKLSAFSIFFAFNSAFSKVNGMYVKITKKDI